MTTRTTKIAEISAHRYYVSLDRYTATPFVLPTAFNRFDRPAFHKLCFEIDGSRVYSRGGSGSFTYRLAGLQISATSI